MSWQAQTVSTSSYNDKQACNKQEFGNWEDSRIERKEKVREG